MKLEVAERIARAKNLLAGHRWFDAVENAIPRRWTRPAREIEYWLGTSIYRTRRDYPGAADKLLTVATRLRGERQAEAMFHGAAHCREPTKMMKPSPATRRWSRLTPSHTGPRSVLPGWLGRWNRTRYREAIGSLLDTVRSYSGPFADEARWYRLLAIPDHRERRCARRL